MRNKKYKLLYQTVRAEFYKRSNAEKFVLEKLITESDPDMQANILQILGHLRSQHALNLSCDFLKHDNVRHREVALFVLGWVGGKEDITLLREHMLHEENPHLRITAASAHRQIGWRLPELKNELLGSSLFRVGNGIRPHPQVPEFQEVQIVT